MVPSFWRGHAFLVNHVHKLQAAIKRELLKVFAEEQGREVDETKASEGAAGWKGLITCLVTLALRKNHLKHECSF